jgi:hypothetical protein
VAVAVLAVQTAKVLVAVLAVAVAVIQRVLEVVALEQRVKDLLAVVTAHLLRPLTHQAVAVALVQ